VAPDVAQTTLRVSYSKRTYVGCTTRAAQIGDLNSRYDEQVAFKTIIAAPYSS
jgi:hypothetical protein